MFETEDAEVRGSRGPFFLCAALANLHEEVDLDLQGAFVAFAAHRSPFLSTSYRGGG
jgi:hypothetical protein